MRSITRLEPRLDEDHGAAARCSGATIHRRIRDGPLAHSDRRDNATVCCGRKQYDETRPDRALAPAAADQFAGHAHDVVERVSVAIHIEHAGKAARSATGG